MKRSEAVPMYWKDENVGRSSIIYVLKVWKEKERSVRAPNYLTYNLIRRSQVLAMTSKDGQIGKAEYQCTEKWKDEKKRISVAVPLYWKDEKMGKINDELKRWNR